MDCLFCICQLAPDEGLEANPRRDHKCKRLYGRYSRGDNKNREAEGQHYSVSSFPLRKQPGTMEYVKLPKLMLKYFIVDPVERQSFWDACKAAVHDNNYFHI